MLKTIFIFQTWMPNVSSIIYFYYMAHTISWQETGNLRTGSFFLEKTDRKTGKYTQVCNFESRFLYKCEIFCEKITLQIFCENYCFVLQIIFPTFQEGISQEMGYFFPRFLYWEIQNAGNAPLYIGTLYISKHMTSFPHT